jgi:MYXO-CTERM domain-containing protein
MKATLVRCIRLVLLGSLVSVGALAGCSVAAVGEEHEACELEPQTLMPQSLEGSEPDQDGDEPIASTSEALSSVSCKTRGDTGYRSGSAFKIKVVTVDGKPVELATANAYMKMAQAAAKSGVQIRVVSGFRTMAEQQRLYQCYLCKCCNGGNLAARPGYSNHQSGHALDLNASSPGVYSWLANNAGKFGFKRTVPSENWHWEFWGKDPGGACGGKTLKAKLSKKWSNAQRYRGKKADYVVCKGDKFKMSLTFKNKGTATWRDVEGRGKNIGSDVFLSTASGKKDKLTGAKRFSVKKNKNSKVSGSRKAGNCTSKNGCRKTTFISGGMLATAPNKPGIYESKWRLRDYSKEHGKKSKAFGPKATVRVKVMACEPQNPDACGCRVWCSDGSGHKVTAKVTRDRDCRDIGQTVCKPAAYLSHHFAACAPPPPPPGTGGTSGTGGGSTAPMNLAGGDELVGEMSSELEEAAEEDGEDNAVDLGEGSEGTVGEETGEEPEFEDDGFDGDEEGLSRGEASEGAASCSVASAPGNTTGGAGALLGLGAVALLWSRRRALTVRSGR